MTPDQLELAARHYCKLMGLDPDEIISVEGALMPYYRWGLVSKELRVHWAMNEALKEGMRDPRVDASINELVNMMDDPTIDQEKLRETLDK
jgi:hypothetical protein